MISTKPFLIRAIREWAEENGLTPEILVDVTQAGVDVPAGYARDGQLVLNIADRAVRMAELGNEWIRFAARFGGARHDVQVPVTAILAVYARENGQGIFFKESETPPSGPEDGSESKTQRPNLRVVK